MKAKRIALAPRTFALAALSVAGASAFASPGDPFAAEVQVSKGVKGQTDLWPAVAVAGDGTIIVTWIRNDGELVLRRFASTGHPLGPETTVVAAGDPSGPVMPAPVIAANGAGRFVLAWTSPTGSTGHQWWSQPFLSDGSPAGPAVQSSTSPAVVYAQPTFMQVAMDDAGDYVVAWNAARSTGAPLRTSFRLHAPDGTPVGTAATAVTSATGQAQYTPSVAMDPDGDVVVAWENVLHVGHTIHYGGYGQLPLDAYTSRAYIRRYHADGARRGSARAITAAAINIPLLHIDQFHYAFPKVAADADGGFIATWEAPYTIVGFDGLNPLHLQRYSQQGQRLGAEQIVTNIPGAAKGRAYTATSDLRGNMVFSWQGLPDVTSPYGSHAESIILKADGSTIGPFAADAGVDGAESPVHGQNGNGVLAYAWARNLTTPDSKGWRVFVRSFEGP